MTLILPDFDKYHPDEVLRIPGTKRDVRVFNGKGKHTESSEHVIGLMHGWLGEGTVDFIAGHLSQQGHSVFTFDEKEWHPGRRNRNAHRSTVVAMKYFDRPTVAYRVHSDAVRAIVGSVIYQSTRDPEELTYEVAEVTTSAGNGTNGMPVNIVEMYKEANGIVDLAKTSPYTSARVYGRSIMNALKSPVTSSLQAALALRYDARPDISRIEEAGVPVRSVFHYDDYVIKSPGGDAEELPGSHMTPIIIPDTMIYLSAA